MPRVKKRPMEAGLSHPMMAIRLGIAIEQTEIAIIVDAGRPELVMEAEEGFVGAGGFDVVIRETDIVVMLVAVAAAVVVEELVGKDDIGGLLDGDCVVEGVIEPGGKGMLDGVGVVVGVFAVVLTCVARS